MSTLRSTALVPLLLAVAVWAPAAEQPAPAADPGAAEGGLTPDQRRFWTEYAESGAANPAAIAAEAKYVEARALYQAARFVEAREAVEAALELYPPHRPAQELREDILAVLGLRDNRLRQAVRWLGDIQDVKTQELAVRMAAKLEEGDRKMAAGDFASAELAYDSVDIALRTFPYQFDWGTLPETVQAKKVEARAQDRRQQIERARGSRDQAEAIARERREMEESTLRAKVDEMLRRARVAYERKDFKRAEIDAWNAYELDRRREDARDLYLAARRQGHVQFDGQHREDRLEKIARVHETIHRSLIPQAELLLYPEDWQRRALRKPRELGSSREEPWMASINDRMEQLVTFEFEDHAFEDVISFFRQVTGLNIVVAAEVYADTPAPITFRARDMRFRESLKWVMQMTGLNMAIQNQAIFISREPISGAVVLRMYDVADLVSPVRDFPGRELAYNAGGDTGGGGFDIFAGADVQDGEAMDPAELVEFIQENVAVGSWENDGVAIDNRGGQTLFVSQAPEVHALIEQLLSNMRNQSKLQVNVNVRLLDVRKNFFEEIGVEYHNNPVGMIGPNASGQGYHRLGSSEEYNGTLRQSLPGNGTVDSYSQQSPQGIYNRGVVVEGSYNISSFLGRDQVNMIFAAVEEETDAQILQHPAITCFNGQRAHASFMSQYAYIADYEVVNNNLDPTVEVLTFGDIIDVKPVVSSDRKYITMEVRPSSVTLVGVFTELILAPRVIPTGTGSFVYDELLPYPLELPNVQVRTLRSTVMLPDKGSLLIGGFQRSLRQRVHSGIPFLSHIPFLGRLFSRNGVYDENRKLFFLLNAEILDLGEKEALR